MDMGAETSHAGNLVIAGERAMRRKIDEELLRAVGERLELARAALLLTQTQFAERAGIARTAYNMVENGERPLHIQDALKLRATYALSLDWIFADDDSGLRHEMANAIKGLRLSRKIADEAMAHVLGQQGHQKARKSG